MALLSSHKLPLAKMYSLEEIACHNTHVDAWIVLFGRVLDVTSFLSLESKELNVFLPLLGKDATAAYTSEGYTFADASHLLKFTVGLCGNKEQSGNDFKESVFTDFPDEEETFCYSSEETKSNLSVSSEVPNHSNNSENNSDEKVDEKTLATYKKSLDFSKPLLSQISKLKKKEYFEVISCPNPTSKVLRMFEWELAEFLSKTQWYVIPLIYIPMCLFLLYCGLSDPSSTYTLSLSLFVIGMWVWSFSEYTFHRFLFHVIEEYLPDNRICISLHFALHAVHHLLPKDPLRLVMPPTLLLFFASPFVLFTIIFIPSSYAYILWSGVLSGYFCYDMIHYSSHHFSIVDKVPHLKKMKIYHMKHHFKDSTKGFGVSSKFWDYIFGTVLT